MAQETDSSLAAIGPAEYDKQIKQYLAKVKRPSARELSKRSLNEILGDEDQPAGTGLDYLQLLYDCYGAFTERSRRIPVDNLLFQKTVQYLLTFDPLPARYVGNEWRYLLDEVYMSACNAGAAHMTIIPLVTALSRLDPSGATFTSFHLPLLRLCLETGHYDQALPILDKAIYSFPQDYPHHLDGKYICSEHRESSAYITVRSGLTTAVSYRDVQEYYLLGGMIYSAIGRDRWEEARLFFELVIISPSQHTATGFMLEAYRKWVLLNLLINGQPPSAPKSASPGALRLIQTAAKPYTALAIIFQDRDVNRLHAEINVGMKTWDEDGNLGLVQLLPEAYQRFYVLQLPRRFSSFPLSRIDADPQQAASIVNDLISTGLNATISTSGSTPIVRFVPSQSSGDMSLSESQLQDRLATQLARVKTLLEAANRADQKIMVSEPYLTMVKRNMRDGPHGDGGAGELHPAEIVMDVRNDEDENIMEGGSLGST